MQKKNFISKLLDFRFDNFIAKDILGVTYITGIVLIVICDAASILGAFSDSWEEGAVAVILGAALGLFCIIVLRVALEIVALFFAIYDKVKQIANEFTPSE